jgi:hypothetical protein
VRPHGGRAVDDFEFGVAGGEGFEVVEVGGCGSDDGAEGDVRVLGKNGCGDDRPGVLRVGSTEDEKDV